MGIFSGLLGGNHRESELLQPVREIIGRTVMWVGNATNFWSRFRKSVDQSKTDYAWWDAFRRGKQRGFEFAGLFAKPITEILASWVLGDAIEPRLVDKDEYTDNLLKKFFKRIHGKLMTIVIDLFALGDQYIIVNPDGSISVPSPDLVEIDYEELDYRKIQQVTITTTLDEAKVTDVYRVDKRVITIQWNDTRYADEAYEYQNLIGKIPVVHLANDRSGNETNGRPIYESLHRLYDRYNNLMEKMIDGAELMGNPIPVVEGAVDPDQTIQNLKADDTDTFYDDDGVEQSRTEIYWDQLTGMVLGEGAHFKFAAPGNGFTEDIRNTLKSMFILVMEHTRIPEAVWGLELSSARATAIEQMKTFHMYINQKRMQLAGMGADDDLQLEAEGGLLELCDIWLRTKALTDRQIKVRPVTLKWSELAQADEELTWKKNESAHNKGVLTDETYLGNLGIVEDAETEVQEANQQMEDEGDRFERDVDAAMQDEAA